MKSAQKRQRTAMGFGQMSITGMVFLILGGLKDGIDMVIALPLSILSFKGAVAGAGLAGITKGLLGENVITDFLLEKVTAPLGALFMLPFFLSVFTASIFAAIMVYSKPGTYSFFDWMVLTAAFMADSIPFLSALFPSWIACAFYLARKSA